MAKKLHYFNANGPAEYIRYLLHYSGKKFEDIQYELSLWPNQKVKEFAPYGQLPVYEEGDRVLNQSVAIARYIARQAGLIPSDPWKEAMSDAAVANVYEFRNKMFNCVIEEDPLRQQALRNKIRDYYVDYYFSRYEKQIKAGNGYFCGKLTWADFALAGFIDMAHVFIEIEPEKKYPAVKALVEKVRALPGVKEYITNKKSFVKDHDLTEFRKFHQD